MKPGVRPSDVYSIFSMDPNEKSFGFDAEISKPGPYRRVIEARREQRRRAAPVANLVDDLLDLSWHSTSPEPRSPKLLQMRAEKDNEAIRAGLSQPLAQVPSADDVPDPETGNTSAPDLVTNNVPSEAEVASTSSRSSSIALSQMQLPEDVIFCNNCRLRQIFRELFCRPEAISR